MSELSNLLRQRLGAGEETGPRIHPDADTLTAYVEQLLATAERNRVVTHLSVCTQCREVVAFSLPELPQPAGGNQAPVRTVPVWSWKRLWTPGFGWAASLAALAITAALVIQLPPKPAGTSAPEVQQTKAASQPEQPSAPKTEQFSPAKPAETANLAAGSAEADRLTKAQTRNLTAIEGRRPATVAPAGVLPAKKEAPSKLAAEETKNLVFVDEQQKQDYVNVQLFAAKNANPTSSKDSEMPSAPAPQPGTTPQGLIANAPGQITAFANIPPSSGKKSKARTMIPLPPPEHFGCTWCKVVEAGAARTLGLGRPTPAISANGLTSSAMGGQGRFASAFQKNQSTQVAPAAAAPEKTEAGDLEKSDAFTRRALLPSAAKTLDERAPLLNWKVADGRLFKSGDGNEWQEAYTRSGADFEFSVVTARGADVWAGGSHAKLLHSRDDGMTWENVKLGDSASATVISIVANGVNIHVKTADNQSWSSADDGNTWVLQSGQN